jgi:hypothetical protein
MDRCQTFMIEYGAPNKLWGYAVEYICTVYCTRVLARNDKTAHELIPGLKPNVSKFVPFYVTEPILDGYIYSTLVCKSFNVLI